MNKIDHNTQSKTEAVADIAPKVRKRHSLLLTQREWLRASVKPPFYWVKLAFDNWGETEWEICKKYILSYATGWVYMDGQNRIVFEKLEDFTIFQLWAKNEPMQKSDTLEVK